MTTSINFTDFRAHLLPPYPDIFSAIEASNICVLDYEEEPDREFGAKFESLARRGDVGLASEEESMHAIAKHQAHIKLKQRAAELRELTRADIIRSPFPPGSGNIWLNTLTGKHHLYRGSVNGREVWLPFDE